MSVGLETFIEAVLSITCGRCKATKFCYMDDLSDALDQFRDWGWVEHPDHKRALCPDCADDFRSGKAMLR